MVSTDVIVEASATLIAGIAFLVTLREATLGREGRRIGRCFLGIVVFTLLSLITAIITAVAEDLIPAALGLPKVWTWVSFFAGLFGLAILVCLLPKRD